MDMDKHITFHIISFIVGGWEPITTRETNPEIHELHEKNVRLWGLVAKVKKEAGDLKATNAELQKENEVMKKETGDLKATNAELQKANEMLKRELESKDKKRKRSKVI
jgi:FtsZ-binding cell division protein ZapB